MAPKRKADEQLPPLFPKIKKLDFTEMIVVVLGQDQEEILVAKHSLTIRSSFFKSACKDTWVRTGEGKLRRIHLPDHEAEIFKIYLQLVYTKVLILFSDEEGVDHLDPQPKAWACYEKLLELSSLTNYIGDVAASNSIIDMWRSVEEGLNVIPGADVFHRVWEDLPHGCTLQKLLKYQALYGLADETFIERVKNGDWPPMLVSELLVELYVDAKDGNRIGSQPGESFHEHNEMCPPCT